uniref:Retrotransposon gag domain-containing protein n=1 Tax=Peronospora matthiolae TaxID=2874970 RepID=A0AAV1V2L5_9STRA
MDPDESFGMQRMSLGPTGAAMLKNRLDPANNGIRSTQIPASQNANTVETSQLQTYSKAAMDKFIRDREEQVSNYPIVPDVEMDSVDSYRDRPGEHESERRGPYDLRRPQVATAGTAPTGGFSAQRIRLSVMADLKEFSGRDQDEERARGWFNKMKTAFLRDQAPDHEKCLVFGELLTGPARSWYSQLSRSTRDDWKSLSEGFRVRYGGYGMSAERQYYHARKRPNETPLEYLDRLNVAGMRAKVAFRDGSPASRREHVEHLIDTLDDRELAKQLTLLRVHDANTMKETLRAYQRMSFRQNKDPNDSNKYRSRSATTPAQVYSNTPRMVKAIRAESEERDSGSSSDDADEE